MIFQINTKEDLIRYIETHELTTNQVNDLLAKTKTIGLFIYDHTPKERAELLRKHFEYIEPPVFIGVDISVKNTD
jgi:hypothetical protein